MSNFWERNKRKSVWALLLLLLRWRRGVLPLLLVLLFIMFAFVAPSNLMAYFARGLAGLPGGARLAAGISWAGARLGLGGFGSEAHSFGELLAAFRAAKDARSAGWGSIFRQGSAGWGAGGYGGDSTGMVRGDLNAAAGGANLGAKVQGGSSISGILTPNEAKEAGGAVELVPADLAGERAGLVNSAYAESAGRVTGKRFAAGFSDAAGVFGAGLSESVGPYASQAFFSSAGHAPSPNNVRSTLSDASVPIAGQTNTATRRPIGWAAPNAKTARAASTARDYRLKGGRAIAQLVTGRNAGLMSTAPVCSLGSGCPPEYATANIGGVYDGGTLGTGLIGTGSSAAGNTPRILTGPVAIDGIAVPTMPDPNVDLGSDMPDPTEMDACMTMLSECQKQKGTARSQLNGQVEKMSSLAGQMGGACGDPCHCGKCNQLKNDIASLCGGPISQSVSEISAPCALPAYCSKYGNMPGANAAQTRDVVDTSTCDPSTQNVQKCGCQSLFCDIGCFLSSL